MKRILLTHSYLLELDPKQKRLGQPYPPLGTLYAAAVLRQNEYSVTLFDSMFAAGAKDLIPSLESLKPDYLVIYEDGFNYLTKMCLSNMRAAAFGMIALAKERNCSVIISGSDSSDHYEEYLKAGADFILTGEAEETLVELLKKSGEENFNPETIRGLAFLRNGQAFCTPKRNVIKDLDAIPFPAWDLIDVEPYRQSWIRHCGYFSMNLATTRGCPYKCNWCAKPIYGNRYNARSPENVLQELVLLKKTYKPDHIWFCDDIFGLKPGWVQEFARLVEETGAKTPFKIQSRADLLVQEAYVASLAKAGCENVWMGAESGSQKILDAMDKGVTIQQIESATALLKNYEIRTSFFIQFGYLDETDKDIQLTITLINKLLPDEIGISVSYPLPGTRFYDKVKEQLQTKANWTDSDDLAMLFQSRYPAGFYRQLHRYVHKTYRKHLALKSMIAFIQKPSRIKLKTIKRIMSVFYYIPAAFVEKVKLEKLRQPA